MIYKLYENMPGKGWKPVWENPDLYEVRQKALSASLQFPTNTYTVVNVNSVAKKIHVLEYYMKGKVVVHRDGMLLAKNKDTIVFIPGRKKICSNSCESSDINVRLWLWALCWPMRALWRSLRACLGKIRGETGE